MATTKTPTITMFGSVFDKDAPNHFPLDETLEIIGTPKNPFRNQIEAIRKSSDHNQANILKAGLPVFCAAGTFSTRTDSGLINYEQAVCIDIDGVSDAKALKREFKANPFTYSCFISPSGNGVKVIVFHDCPNAALHPAIYGYLGDLFNVTARSGMSFDSKCQNISRACYLSYDPNIYINPSSKVVPIDPTAIAVIKSPTTSTEGLFSPHDEIRAPPLMKMPSAFTDVKKLKVDMVRDLEEFERFHSFYPGHRNESLNLLTVRFRSKGYPFPIVLNFLKLYYGGQHTDFTTAEIDRTVRSVYKNI